MWSEPASYPGQSSPGSRFGTDVRASHEERNTFSRQSREMRAEKKCKWLRPLRRKSDGFGAGISTHDLELKEDHMATKPMNLNAGSRGCRRWSDERHNSRSLAGREAGMGSHCSASATRLFFAHGAQKLFSWFGVTAGMVDAVLMQVLVARDFAFHMQARSEPRRSAVRCPARWRHHILVHLGFSLPKTP